MGRGPGRRTDVVRRGRRAGGPHLGTALTELSNPEVRRVVVGVPAGLIGLGAVLEMLGVAPVGELLRRRRAAALG